jgi:hypothetical protein
LRSDSSRCGTQCYSNATIEPARTDEAVVEGVHAVIEAIKLVLTPLRWRGPPDAAIAVLVFNPERGMPALALIAS